MTAEDRLAQPDEIFAREIYTLACKLGITESQQPVTGPEILLLLQEIGWMADAAPSSGILPDQHEHRFQEYMVCTECGRTEAAIHGCHHCDEVLVGKRCWWCLTLKTE